VIVAKVVIVIALTGLFQLTDHKCCFYATNSSHKCYLALVAFPFLRYNNSLIGDNMIKPNTLCMIRGVPHEYLGNEFNGRVVTATGFKGTSAEGLPVYWIEPAMYDDAGRKFTGCREQWLFPFSDPDTLGLTDKTLELA
jgi:hypothetical protein